MTKVKKTNPKDENVYEEEKDTPVLKCHHCDATFEKTVQLGGHISKAHPGVSKQYAEKMKIRD